MALDGNVEFLTFLHENVGCHGMKRRVVKLPQMVTSSVCGTRGTDVLGTKTCGAAALNGCLGV